ncbi:YggT family protein [Caulobacter sp. 73W]|jgi:YggT family protein|uniref:YggT family protein n=1 Tax=Caulobacter sp. 73W TaxID=3161137 RepID=A0AB39KPG7_9CAUL
MGYAIVWLVNTIISLLIFLIFARAIVSWLVAFDIINTRNRFVYQVLTMLERITDPILSPLQRVLPTLGGIDISPIVAWLLLQFVQIIFNRTLAPIIVGALG